MKILHLSQFIPPMAGGEEHHVRNLARAQAARGHDVTLLGFAAGDDGPGASVVDDVRVVRVPTLAARFPALYSDPTRPHALPLPDPEASRAIRQELGTSRYDVAHAHNWIVNSALGPTASAGVPLVMTLHDYSHVCATKRLMEFERTRCPGPSPKRCMPCAAHHYGAANGAVTVAANAWTARRRARLITRTAAVSSAVADAVDVAPGRWLHSAALHARVIPNFIPDDVIVEEIAPTAPDAPLLYVGDLSYDKGVQVLLDAYELLDSPPALTLVGRTATPDAWHFPPGTHWAGEVPHYEALALFRSACLVVVPSVWSDPCPTVVLEAMAAGRPVVGAASGGIVDMVADGVTGLLVPPGDPRALAAAIDTLLKQPQTALAFGAASRERAREFTVSAVAARIEQMYADAIDAGRHP